jgi:hypothetical protein
MKVYQDLTIRGRQQDLDQFVDTLEGRLTGGWFRRHDREAEVSSRALGKLYCYACTADRSRPESELWVATKTDGSMYVSNIWAREFSSLTYDQYNSILSNFYETCIRPAAKLANVTIDLGNPDPRIEDFLSANAVELLRSFSSLANRSMLHPYDRRRWNEFLVAAHREGTELDASMLKRWLTEEEKWPDDQANSLASEYADAEELLEVYESLQT